MKLFIRDNLPLIGIWVVQLLIVPAIYWLDGFRNLTITLYAVFVGLFFLALYLKLRYARRRVFWRLAEPPKRLDESLRRLGEAPLAAALEKLLRTYYRQYLQILNEHEKEQTDHLIFINQWVHQIKSPLSVIELVVQDEDDPRFVMIRDESERINAGLETVLYATRLKAFEQDFSVAEFPLKTIVDKVIHENKRLFIKNHLYPVVKVGPDILVESDAKWLSFALNQLITNAIKYSAGTGKYVTVSAWKGGRTIIVEIQGEGIGIPKSDLKRAFRPFFYRRKRACPPGIDGDGLVSSARSMQAAQSFTRTEVGGRKRDNGSHCFSFVEFKHYIYVSIV